MEGYRLLNLKMRGFMDFTKIKKIGESLLKALWVMWKLKRNGAACLKLEWRVT